MNKKMFFPLSLCLFIFVLFSCSKEENKVEPIVKKDFPRVTARIPSSDVPFIANFRFQLIDDCLPFRGTCDWRWNRGCDIAWPGSDEEGLEAIEELENADALFNIETFQDESIIGFRFLGFSSQFLEASAANGDDGFSFRVVEDVKINQEATNILGYESIEIKEGEYSIFIDADTGEQVVYIDAVLE